MRVEAQHMRAHFEAKQVRSSVDDRSGKRTMSAQDAADEHDEPRREDAAQPPARPAPVENGSTREAGTSGEVEAPTIALQPGESVTIGSAPDN